MSRHTYETTLAFGSDERGDFIELDVKVAFDFRPGCAAQTYGDPSGCWPAEADEIDGITLLEIGGKPKPWGWLYWSDKAIAEMVLEALEASETHLERMLEIASEDHVALEDEISERRWADRCEEYAA